VTDGNRNTGCKKIAQMAEILNIYCKQLHNWIKCQSKARSPVLGDTVTVVA